MNKRQQLLEAFDAMDDQRQDDMLEFLKDVARNFPRAPRLRLVHRAPDLVPLLAAGKEAG